MQVYNNIFDEKLLDNVVNYSYNLLQQDKLEKNFYLKIFLFMTLVLFFIEMNRVSEYGNDTGGHLFFILTIYFSLKILLEKKLTSNAV